MAPLWTLALLLTLGCSAKTSEGDRQDEVGAVYSTDTETGRGEDDVPLEGIHVSAFEGSGFRPCGGGESLWAEFDSAAVAVRQEVVPFACGADLLCNFFLSGIGDRAPPGAYGHLNAWDGQVTFTSIEQFIPISPDSGTAEACPLPEQMTILGQVLSPDGSLSVGYAHIAVVTFEEWAGEIPNDAAEDFSTVTDDGYFAISVPPGRWGVMASFGTCSSAPLVEAIGDPGGVVGVELVVNCVE